MSRTQFFAVLFALTLAVGCKAQPPAQSPSNAVLNRQIEVLVRSQFSLPPDVSVTIGTRKPAQIPGYDTLPISLTRNSHSEDVEFLISKDSKTLARLETMQIDGNPIFSINTANRPIRGNPDAKVTIVSFDDYQCPYCGRMHQTLFPETLAHYKDKIRVIYKDNPLSMHPWAMRAAIDANCIGAQNNDTFWSYVDYLHTHGSEINGTDRNTLNSFNALDRIAREQGTIAKLDSAKLDACISKQNADQVHDSMKDATALHIDSAPSLYINGEHVSGALPKEQLWPVIDRALRSVGIEPPPPEPAATPAAAAPAPTK